MSPATGNPEPSPKIQKIHDNNGVSEFAPAPFLRVKRLSDKAILPSRASPLSAGYDLSSEVETKVPVRGKTLVPTDLSITVPQGTYARIGAVRFRLIRRKQSSKMRKHEKAAIIPPPARI